MRQSEKLRAKQLRKSLSELEEQKEISRELKMKDHHMITKYTKKTLYSRERLRSLQQNVFFIIIYQWSIYSLTGRAHKKKGLQKNI